MSEAHHSADNAKSNPDSSSSEPGSPADSDFDSEDESLTTLDLVREGARRDGVELAYYEPRYTDPRERKVEKRIERTIALCLFLAGIGALAFIVVFAAWHWEYSPGRGADKWFTPLLGTGMGVALLGISFAVLIWSKKLLPIEESIQDRHDGASPEDERAFTGATMVNALEETGIKRRPLLKGALAFGLIPVGAMAVVPLGAMIKDPGNDLFKTGFRKGVRLVRLDGSPVRPEDVSAGGMETVFPGIPEGTTNKYADSPTILIHLRAEDMNKVTIVKGREDWHYGQIFAYSKICTHLGCPASLYEQQDHRLLCPCHQSQFDVLDKCTPVFGPATRPLPQLPITVDEEGYFVARSDYHEAVGPAFWERP